ncbi:TetR/AcrR family transcriptional regulator [Novosphingobium piscinae]|uniref:TetR/AcrR family transcriptional regulator n=1 Tax=Novosphingobium piscinae TaxID=1507448 RepID=A0A7X1KR69_9SPHN|nr:TetR/AcrR family transcriptional regulator [Novosphingobium piscinae]MBC2670407.1 TetR/AcrR family transcriptional regulator [Novosphingobium piscinae]
MSIRRRLTQEESRTQALDAARALLIEAGPAAVTLKAVAQRIGRTHANLLHHFGSAAGLQTALAAHLAGTICATIGQTVLAARAGLVSPRVVVDLTFDAFDREGGGALASWMLLSGNEDALDPIVAAIRELVEDVHEPGTESMRAVTQSLVLLALGDALMGGPLSQSLDLPRTAARDQAERLLIEGAARAGITMGCATPAG